jgi:hypothetical protein
MPALTPVAALVYPRASVVPSRCIQVATGPCPGCIQGTSQVYPGARHVSCHGRVHMRAYQQIVEGSAQMQMDMRRTLCVCERDSHIGRLTKSHPSVTQHSPMYPRLTHVSNLIPRQICP